MKIAVTGSTGLIGSALVDHLRGEDHEVLRLVRRPARAADEVTWDPGRGTVDLDRLHGVDAAVHLAGAGIGDRRWTEGYKRTVRDSRVLGTRTLVTALRQLTPLPRAFVLGSAVGYYGSRGEEVLTEASGPGTGFIPDVVQAWEAEAEPARSAGIRVVQARSGLVMSRRGGAFGRLLLLTRCGLGGPLGDGRQWWPWITLEDHVRALTFLLGHELEGPVNLSAPEPARNVEITRALGRQVRRPTVLPAPAFALRIVLGEFAGEILASQRMVPQRLLESGFDFRHPRLEAAAAWVTAG